MNNRFTAYKIEPRTIMFAYTAYCCCYTRANSKDEKCHHNLKKFALRSSALREEVSCDVR